MRFGCQAALAVVPLLAIFLTDSLGAQTTSSGGLTGTVVDATNRVVPDATVELRSTANGAVKEAKTDADGNYLFSFLQPGNYVLKATHPGFETTSMAVEVLLGPPRTVNFKLPIAPISKSVTVKGELPPLNAENGDSSTTITQLQVSEVPNPGNDLTYIAQLAPGVVMNTDANGPAITLGNFSSLGMPGISNLFTLNGMNYNDMGFSVNMTGTSFMSLGQNQIQEATVVSNGYSGQFGLYAGANVNYVSKSGGNEFHGNATYYWNGRVFNANNWFNNASGVPRPFDIANQWAGSLGGPIKTDKFFFFANTEGLELLIPSAPFPVVMPSPQFEAATIAHIDSIFGPTSASDAFYKQIFNLYNTAPGASRATPGAPGDPSRLGCGGFQGLGSGVPCAFSFESDVTGQPTREFLVSGRVDWNVGTSDRAFLLVQYDVGRQPTNTDPINVAFNATTNRPWWQGQLLENHAFGSSVSNQFTLGAYWASLVFKLVNPSQAYSTFPTVLSWESSGLSFTDLGGLDWLIPNGKNATQYQIADDLFVVRGKHKLGFGEYFLRDDWTVLPPTRNRIGILSPQTLDAFYQGGVDLASPGSDYTQLIQSFGASGSQHVAFYNLALYAQDEWHVRPSLTLTVTLRAEHQSNPICHERCFARLAGSFASISHDPNQPYNQAILVNQKQAYEEMSNILWLPRFSFAWQPFGVSHNTVLRGGAGIFYDPLPGNLFLNFRANAPLFNQFTVIGNNLAPNETSSLFKDAANSNAAFVEGFASGATLAEIETQIPQFFPPAFNNSVDFINSPQYQKWSLELQQALGPSTTLSVGYFGHHGIHLLIQNPSANAWGFASFPSRLCTDQLVLPCADPRFSQVTELSSVAISNYDGMVVSVQHRFNQGMLQANYTYSHALDEASNGGLGFSFTSASSIFPQDPNNIRGSYGSAEFDVRHSFNASYVWQVPIKRMLLGHGPTSLVDGWEIAGTIFARTGFPYTVLDGAEASRLNNNNFYGSIYAVPAALVGSASNPKTDFTTIWQTYPPVTWNRFSFYSLGLYGQEEWRARANLTLTLALRADHQSNPVCESRCFARLSSSFDSISHDPDQPYNQAILINQKQAYLNTDSIVWSPRFSFAWQPLGGSHNAVIRGGIGIFYDPVPGSIGTTLASNPPSSNFYAFGGYNLAPSETNSLSKNAAASNSAFVKGFATGQTLAQIQEADPNFSPPNIQTPANTIHSPQYQKWSLQAQQSFGSSSSLTIGYFGNHGIHEFFDDPNINAFGFGSFPRTVCTSPPVPPCADARFSGVTQHETGAISNYNGMVVSFEQRFTRWGGGMFQANYTYGHALDEVSNGGWQQFAFGSSFFPQDANNLRGSYGPADYDARHSFNANYVWEVPVKEVLRGHGPDPLVKGWQISGTVIARTGFPYTVIDNAETGNLVGNNFFGTIYSVPVAPLGPAGPCGKGAVIPSSPVPCQPAQVLGDGSPSAGALFLQTGCETGFNAGNLPGPKGPCSGPSVTFAQGRNRYRGPSYVNTDFAVMKNTKIPRWEPGVLTIGFQFFNLFNHANFGFPDNWSSDNTFGQILYQEQAPTSVLGSGLNANVSPRMIQLRVQLQF